MAELSLKRPIRIAVDKKFEVSRGLRQVGAVDEEAWMNGIGCGDETSGGRQRDSAE